MSYPKENLPVKKRILFKISQNEEDEEEEDEEEAAKNASSTIQISAPTARYPNSPILQNPIPSSTRYNMISEAHRNSTNSSQLLHEADRLNQNYQYIEGYLNYDQSNWSYTTSQHQIVNHYDNSVVQVSGNSTNIQVIEDKLSNAASSSRQMYGKDETDEKTEQFQKVPYVYRTKISDKISRNREYSDMIEPRKASRSPETPRIREIENIDQSISNIKKNTQIGVILEKPRNLDQFLQNLDKQRDVSREMPKGSDTQNVRMKKYRTIKIDETNLIRESSKSLRESQGNVENLNQKMSQGKVSREMPKFSDESFIRRNENQMIKNTSVVDKTSSIQESPKNLDQSQENIQTFDQNMSQKSILREMLEFGDQPPVQSDEILKIKNASLIDKSSTIRESSKSLHQSTENVQTLDQNVSREMPKVSDENRTIKNASLGNETNVIIGYPEHLHRLLVTSDQRNPSKEMPKISDESYIRRNENPAKISRSKEYRVMKSTSLDDKSSVVIDKSDHQLEKNRQIFDEHMPQRNVSKEMSKVIDTLYTIKTENQTISKTQEDTHPHQVSKIGIQENEIRETIPNIEQGVSQKVLESRKKINILENIKIDSIQDLFPYTLPNIEQNISQMSENCNLLSIPENVDEIKSNISQKIEQNVKHRGPAKKLTPLSKKAASNVSRNKESHEPKAVSDFQNQDVRSKQNTRKKHKKYSNSKKDKNAPKEIHNDQSKELIHNYNQNILTDEPQYIQSRESQTLSANPESSQIIESRKTQTSQVDEIVNNSNLNRRISKNVVSQQTSSSIQSDDEQKSLKEKLSSNESKFNKIKSKTPEKYIKTQDFRMIFKRTSASEYELCSKISENQPSTDDYLSKYNRPQNVPINFEQPCTSKYEFNKNIESHSIEKEEQSPQGLPINLEQASTSKYEFHKNSGNCWKIIEEETLLDVQSGSSVAYYIGSSGVDEYVQNEITIGESSDSMKSVKLGCLSESSDEVINSSDEKITSKKSNQPSENVNKEKCSENTETRFIFEDRGIFEMTMDKDFEEINVPDFFVVTNKLRNQSEQIVDKIMKKIEEHMENVSKREKELEQEQAESLKFIQKEEDQEISPKERKRKKKKKKQCKRKKKSKYN